MRGWLLYKYAQDELPESAYEAARILNLDVAGVDLLFAGEGFKICEVNSSPMFGGLEGCY